MYNGLGSQYRKTNVKMSDEEINELQDSVDNLVYMTFKIK